MGMKETYWVVGDHATKRPQFGIEFLLLLRDAHFDVRKRSANMVHKDLRII